MNTQAIEELGNKPIVSLLPLIDRVVVRAAVVLLLQRLPSTRLNVDWPISPRMHSRRTTRP